MSKDNMNDLDLDPERTYSSDEVRQMVAHRVIDLQLDQFRINIAATDTEVRNISAKFDTEFDQIKKLIADNGRKISEGAEKTKLEIRAETEKFYVSKAELQVVESRFNTAIADMSAKIDKIWLKIAGPVIGAVFIAQWLLSVYESFKAH